MCQTSEVAKFRTLVEYVIVDMSELISVGEKTAADSDESFPVIHSEILSTTIEEINQDQNETNQVIHSVPLISPFR